MREPETPVLTHPRPHEEKGCRLQQQLQDRPSGGACCEPYTRPLLALSVQSKTSLSREKPPQETRLPSYTLPDVAGIPPGILQNESGFSRARRLFTKPFFSVCCVRVWAVCLCPVELFRHLLFLPVFPQQSALLPCYPTHTSGNIFLGAFRHTSL